MVKTSKKDEFAFQPSPSPPTRPLSDWLRALDRHLMRAEKLRFHGKIEISVYDGKVNRVSTQSSVNDPDKLAPDDLASDEDMHV